MDKPVRREGGIPDGLVVGLLALLLGLTVLVWTATGLSALLAHGAWPDGVTFTRTPLALRALVSAPTDLPAAWPGTPPSQLSGYGLFWGLVIGEAMILAVLTIFAVGTLARWRTVRRAPAAAHGGAPAGAGAGVGVSGRVGDLAERSEGKPAVRTSPPPRRPLTPAGAPAAPHPSAPHPSAPQPEPEPEPQQDHRQQHPLPTPRPPAGPEPAGPPAAPAATAAPAGAAPAAPSLPAAPEAPATSAQPPVTPQAVVYAQAAARRPQAAQAVLDAEGAVLVVTSDPTLWAETKDARAKLGPVLVYDPGHLCDTPARLRWSPAERCEDADVARERAVALLAPVRPQSRLDAAVADTAETLLRCWLHAAATDGRPFKQVHRWAQGTDAHDPVRILRTHPKAAAGHAGLLESALTAHPERRRAAQALTARALSSLSSIHIRDACTANRTDSLTLASFVAEQGTLYVVGEPIEDPRTHPGAMPLLTALAASVVEHGRRMAARSSDGRLDPPLRLVLDDVAAVAPIPGLPELVARGTDLGLPTLALMRSPEQARSRWPDPLPQP
ncbi:type IV secretory system conjugative DNA transfer family protein [Streptomyces sp. NPDC048018]|uniref:type IV secretory system conjugative DNA transfer family protein n=1 Tax=Streptomyces sp. NPDC048018 TaxID=3365499 RepID=UPI0037201AE3